MSIYSKYWLINKTGLRLLYRSTLEHFTSHQIASGQCMLLLITSLTVQLLWKMRTGNFQGIQKSGLTRKEAENCRNLSCSHTIPSTCLNQRQVSRLPTPLGPKESVSNLLVLLVFWKSQTRVLNFFLLL